MTAVDHAELKPCPFCGSAAKLETYGDRLGISCAECFCRTPLCQPGEDPLPIWNLRAQAPDSWRPGREVVEDVACTLRSVSCDLANAEPKWANHANDLMRDALRLEALCPQTAET